MARPPPRIAAAAVLLHAGPREGPEGPLAVLVLAGQAEIRDRLAGTLRGAGHRVEALGLPGAALDRLHVAPFDAVVAAFRMPAPAVLGLARTLRALPPPLGRIALLGLSPMTSEQQRREGSAAGFDQLLPELSPPAEVLLDALGRAVLARWGLGPLAADLRATLAASLSPEALEAADAAAIRAAGERALALREGSWTAAAVREAAEAIAAALTPVGALAAPAAARALAAAPERRNALLPPVLSSLVALRMALRRDREARRAARPPISGADSTPPSDPKDPAP